MVLYGLCFGRLEIKESWPIQCAIPSPSGGTEETSVKLHSPTTRFEPSLLLTAATVETNSENVK